MVTKSQISTVTSIAGAPPGWRILSAHQKDGTWEVWTSPVAAWAILEDHNGIALPFHLVDGVLWVLDINHDASFVTLMDPTMTMESPYIIRMLEEHKAELERE